MAVESERIAVGQQEEHLVAALTAGLAPQVEVPYPAGVAVEDLPLGARIVAVAASMVAAA